MNYNLNEFSIDISEHCNEFNILSQVKYIVFVMEGEKEADAFIEECLGEDEKTLLFKKIGGSWGYEDLLRLIVEKTGISLISTRGKLDIPDDIYTIVS